MSKIKTTGQLRDFLADMIVSVKNGTLDVDKASRITKMAAQINESLYSEIKVATIQKDLEQETSPFGSLVIGEEQTKAKTPQ